MIRTLLGLDETQDIAGIELRLQGGWLLALGLAVVGVAFVVWLYRSEQRLSRGRRMVLGGLQVLAFLTLLVIVLEPVADVLVVKPLRETMLVLLDTSRSMSFEDQRTTPGDVIEAGRTLGEIPLAGQDAPGRSVDIDAVREQVGKVSRIALARAALANEEIDPLGALSRHYQVRSFTFADRVEPEIGAMPPEGQDDESPLAWLGSREASGDASRLGSAMEEAVARYAGQPLAGVLVISDFTRVKGRDPVSVARDLARRGVPVHAAPVGLPAPPDVHLRRIIAPEVVFKGDRVPIRVQVEASGFVGRAVELTLEVDGQPATSEQVELRDGVQFVELMFIPQRDSGTLELELELASLEGEASTANNRRAHRVRILDEKIRVLYVEGMPRWEYRYLRWVLLRDQRLEVTFLMTQGDPALAATSPRHVARFPASAEEVLAYDLIILGDVPASYFNEEQLASMEELVKKGGGSLLMLAGPMAAPSSYRDTPVARALPVKIGDGRTRPVAANAYPVITAAGRESAVAALSLSEQTNERIWSHVRPMHALPDLAGAKSGATVLLTLPKAAEQLDDYPLVAWHRHGNGKSLFVATEDLWRMRLEVGDRYHARFWGQTIQFLALSRLLGQNKQISLETDRRGYGAGEQVRVFANVLTETFDPVVQPSYTVVMEQAGTPDSSVEIELTPVPDSPGLYSGVQLAREDASYVVRTKPQDAGISNRVEFEVRTVPLEDRETAARPDVARQIAEITGGEALELSELGTLVDRLEAPAQRTSIVRLQHDLWDVPLLYVLLVLFAGAEWYLRRRDNLV